MIFNLAGGSKPEQTKTVTPSTSKQEVTPDSGYALSKVTVNAMTTATQATPTISVDSAGKITASATQTAGYVAAGTKSATKQLTVQAAKTVTPSSSSQTAVAAGVYITGAITVAAIPSTYKNMAAGTVTAVDTGSGSTRHRVTVTGLSFTPTNVVLVRNNTSFYDVCNVVGTTGYGVYNGGRTRTLTRSLTQGGFMLSCSNESPILTGSYYWIAWA